MPCRKRLPVGSSGFSLLEVMMVLAITAFPMTLLTTALIPLEREMALQATASQLLAQPRSMQNLAADQWTLMQRSGWIHTTQVIVSCMGLRFSKRIRFGDGRELRGWLP